MSVQPDPFPVLDIREFSEHPSPVCDLLFHELRGENLIDTPHKHNFFIIILFEKGSGSHTIDFKTYPVEDQQVHLVFPNQVHEWHLQQGTVAYQLMISRQWFEIFWPALRHSMSRYQTHPVHYTKAAHYRLLLHEFIAIQQELRQEKDTFWELIQARTRVIGLLVNKMILSGFDDAAEIHSNVVVDNFLQLVEDHFKEQRAVSFYAGHLNISANYLNVICRKSLNTTASSIIKERILLEAKRLLKGSEMSVKDIIYDLNFYDHASFTRFFKLLTGMTPSAFRA